MSEAAGPACGFGGRSAAGVGRTATTATDAQRAQLRQAEVRARDEA
eukprot:CAMPEP_0197919354 /NCGR_PEP_ID=MMETSP1439-20131203/87096_1 /TAXON_ID=66791 /ORGANISM="Gonyaulax spinifera, Strain CCMP409" /LENGTH=45 /DNA_ID= /DNA_START= /DNA_END= /DNA_ORIENTATION=